MLDNTAQTSINCCQSLLHASFAYYPLPDDSMRVCIATCCHRPSGKPSADLIPHTCNSKKTLQNQIHCMTIKMLTLRMMAGAGAQAAARGMEKLSVT